MNNNRYSFFFQESKKKRGPMLRRTIPIILLALAPALLCAQVSSGADQLREGLLLFKQERYTDAIRAFRAVIFYAQDEQNRAAIADAYYWISRAFLAIDNYEEAASNLEYFLANFPSHPYYSDALYQKGQLLYLQNDPESGIQVLERFVRDYPDSQYVGSAYFWIGECLLSLGYLDEAARVYNKVIVEHPTSVKLEASRYRLSLIEYKKREDELLRLLHWSHEEGSRNRTIQSIHANTTGESQHSRLTAIQDIQECRNCIEIHRGVCRKYCDKTSASGRWKGCQSHRRSAGISAGREKGCKEKARHPDHRGPSLAGFGRSNSH